MLHRSFSLRLLAERKLSPFEYPMDELEALPEEQQAAARFFLKRNVVEKVRSSSLQAAKNGAVTKHIFVL